MSGREATKWFNSHTHAVGDNPYDLGAVARADESLEDDAPGVHALFRRVDSRVRYIYDGATWRRREEWTALHEV